MNPLLYSSNEMFSSTELIRKSKMIFDKLLKSEIEKAIILRDGKPGFMLLDFEEYEKLMKEYLRLKEDTFKNIDKEIVPEEIEKIEIKEDEKIITNVKEKDGIEKIGFSMNADLKEKPSSVVDDISEEELKKALEDIESLHLEDDKENVKKEEHRIDDDLDELSYQKKEQPLKEFWD